MQLLSLSEVCWVYFFFVVVVVASSKIPDMFTWESRRRGAQLTAWLARRLARFGLFGLPLYTLLLAVSLHHVRVGGDGRHGPDPPVGLPQATQRGYSRGAQQEAGQQGAFKEKDIEAVQTFHGVEPFGSTHQSRYIKRRKKKKDNKIQLVPICS